jgi:hypothetical protein
MKFSLSNRIMINNQLKCAKILKRIIIILLFLFLVIFLIYFYETYLFKYEYEFENIDSYEFNYLVKRFRKMRKMYINQDPIKHYTTVVSIYFPLYKSKHSIINYDIWNRNALNSIEAPMIIFTNRESKRKFLHIRPNNTIYFIYDDVWQLFKELETWRNKSYIYNYLHLQRPIDSEKFRHVPELYAIWNLKAFLMNRVAKLNPFKSKFIIYSDLGAWRREVIPNWPDNKFVKIVNERLNDRILFGQIAKIKNEVGDVNILNDIIEGTYWAGSPESIYSYAKKFYDIHDERFDMGFFVGKDQTIMNFITFKTQIKNYVRIRSTEINLCNNSNSNKLAYDAWFFFQQYFSHYEYFKCPYKDKLSILINL